MKVVGSSVLHAPPSRVWEVINDPAVLAGVIPGCDRFTELADGHFAVALSLGVASIKGSYTGEIRLSDRVEPSALTLRASGSGAPGTIDTTVAVRLTDGGDGTTTLEYDADATVGGMVGGVGQRVLTGVARKTAGLFFTAIDEVLTGAPPSSARPDPKLADAAEAPGAGGIGAEYRVTAPGRRPGPAQLVGAAVFGALSMLVGVLVGARIGRRP